MAAMTFLVSLVVVAAILAVTTQLQAVGLLVSWEPPMTCRSLDSLWSCRYHFRLVVKTLILKTLPQCFLYLRPTLLHWFSFRFASPLFSVSNLDCQCPVIKMSCHVMSCQ